ncbi:hypothetical protein EW146_g6731 [Bondarzewia mesenterica]|uniref:U3 small nucleolar RNA-associated protein 13 C-terminal domain-containing protein n=1 Tax=Bondarzewia mesenterica TaxID=1095465 RepID=A0A4S4LPK6_9AGAM|nr:hypothetical protein EW146_g6731 [Bondarzewia mesenterica]
MSGSRSKTKTAFKKSRVIAPLYTGGPVAVTPDGQRLVTCVGEEAILTDIEQGEEFARFVGDTESITALCVTPSGNTLIQFTSSMSMRIYDLPSSHQSKPVHPTRVVARAHDAPVHVCRADPTSTYLASGAADGTVKVWDIARGFVTHVLRGHGGVVSALAFNFPRMGLGLEEPVLKLVTASVDTKVRVWDLARSAEAARSGKSAKPEAVLEGHVSVPRGLDVSEDGRWLISGGRDAVVLVWDLGESKRKAKDKKVGKGKEKEQGPVLAKTITTLERVEAVGLIGEDEDVQGASGRKDSLRFFTAGEKGVVKIWDGKQGSVLCTLGEERITSSEDHEEQRQILNAMYVLSLFNILSSANFDMTTSYVPSTSTVISIHADQNILFHSLRTASLSRQLIGFNDEIIDAAFLHSPSSSSSSSSTHLALATNSSLIRLYSTSSLDARLLAGHTDIVLCLASSSGSQVFASGAKDRSARLWAPLSSSASASFSGERGWGCVSVCEGHAESVGALAFARRGGPDGEETLKFMFTGSQDRTIKMWDLSTVPTMSAGGKESEIVKCKSLCTHKAHDKDINALDVSPNDALLASGSQDRTAKVFAISFSPASSSKAARGELKLVGTCRGHKRGVWSVRFAKHERVLASGGGDRTVRIWGLDDFACMKVLEGHVNSVLRVEWLGVDGEQGGQGQQVVSAAADGLVKVWDVKSEECVATLDGHEDKVWALAVSEDQRTIVSGAADSVVTFWEDCTEEQEAAKEIERAELVLKEQDFLNYVSLHDYRRAIELALSLSQPGRLFTLFKDLASSESELNAITGHLAVDEVIRTLHPSDLTKLLRYVRDWNARASSSIVAQRVLHAVVKLRPAEDVIKAFEVVGEGDEENKGLKELVEALIPYTERHLARMERLVQESYVVDYVLGEMDGGLDVAEDQDAMQVDFAPAVGIRA